MEDASYCFSDGNSWDNEFTWWEPDGPPCQEEELPEGE
jgi:hypothetical protein